MKKHTIYLFSILALLSISFSSAYAAKQEDKKTPTIKYEARGEKTIQRIIERAKPTDMNIQALAPLVGEWNYTASFWTNSDDKPQPSTGSVKNELVLEDKYLSSTVLGSLNIDGHDILIKGQGLTGYNNTSKRFTSIWADSISTGMMTGSGAYDLKNRTMKETGTFAEHLTGAEKEFRAETQLTNPSHYKRTIFTTDASGKEYKMMEIKYTRAK